MLETCSAKSFIRLKKNPMTIGQVVPKLINILTLAMYFYTYK